MSEITESAAAATVGVVVTRDRLAGAGRPQAVPTLIRLRIVDGRARDGNEVRLGILPAVVSPYVVRKIGFAHATALFTSGIRFDSRRAYEVGLVEAVEEPAKLDGKIDFYLDAIVAGGPHAVNAAKRLVREVAGRPVAEVREKTVERIAGIRVSDEGQEGMRSFLERRKPKW